MGKKNKFTKLTDEMNYKRHSVAQCSLCHENNYELCTNTVSINKLKYRPMNKDKVNKARFIVHNDDIDNTMEHILINSNPGFAEKFRIYCPRCEKVTVHNVIDYNISSIINTLNKMGISTTFSCEGHFDKGEFSSPYITFANELDRKYFDMSNTLLKYWTMDISKIQAGAWSLRLRCDQVSIDYFASGSHLDDLYSYITNVVAVKVKKKESENNVRK